MDQKPSTGTSTRGRPWILKSDCGVDHESVRARQPVLAADGRHPTRAERERCFAIQFPHLRYLDGLDLYGQQDFADLPLPDQLHPDGPAHRRIGERFAKLAFGRGGAFFVERATP